MANILVACEYSGRVREAFRKLGHKAWSCDLLPADDGSPYHYQQDIFKVQGDWDAIISFPPCTYIANSGNRWYANTDARERGLQFALKVWNLPAKFKCMENPIGILSSAFRKPDQIIQPWQFGHPETKATCLWLHNLPPLVPTNIVEGREQRIWKMPPSPDRSKLRSLTYQGVADAMATQWSPIINAGAP